jgi:predicted GIY-YIG superfamily endonuclease
MNTISKYILNTDYIHFDTFFIDDELVDLIKANYTRIECVNDIISEINKYSSELVLVSNLAMLLQNVINGDIFNKEIINEMFNSLYSSHLQLPEFQRRLYKEKSNNPINAIYKITCTENESIYIGSTSDFLKRKIMHQYCLKARCHHNKNLMADYLKYGADKFIYEIMHKADSDINRDELYLLEQIYIDKYDPEYNIIKEGVAYGSRKYKTKK